MRDWAIGVTRMTCQESPLTLTHKYSNLPLKHISLYLWQIFHIEFRSDIQCAVTALSAGESEFMLPTAEA